MYKVPKSINLNKKITFDISISNTNLIVTDIMNVSFKRSLSFEQHLLNVASSGNITQLNNETYNLLFYPINEKKGFLTNLVDKTIQQLPCHMYAFKKALNPATFFNSNPHLNIAVNPNNFSSLQHLHQRTNIIGEISVAKAYEIKFNEKVILSQGNILNSKLSLKQTGQSNSDFFCAKVLDNGQVYNYYADMKITDKQTFLNKISTLHPQKLAFCQVYLVGGVTDSFVFDTSTKFKLINGCTHYMSQHIIDNTPLVAYKNQLNSDLQIFDNNPTIENYNSLIIAPWRIFTVPSLSKLLNA